MKNGIAGVLFLILAAAAPAQDRPGDARRGGQLFEQQRCVICHSINGVGGGIAPDLARRSLKQYSPSILAATMWNHAPSMWQAMAARGVPVPRLEPGDVADLFAYFYSLHYFALPGDAARGKEVIINARCVRCHGGDGPGPPVAKWKATTNPIEWAQQMWNHNSRMTREVEKLRVPWPQLTSQQMVDVMTYAQNLPGAEPRSPLLRFEDPVAGAKLFEAKRCSECHILGGPGQPNKIDLLRRTERFRTLVDFATAMWNHSPQMQRRARQKGLELPVLQDYEMSDLLAYLFDRHYFDERGNASRGGRIYRSRHCADCHDTGQAGAPQLAQYRGRFSSMFVTSALWKHGPQMLAEMQKRGWKWPVFVNTELADLIAYLNK